MNTVTHTTLVLSIYSWHKNYIVIESKLGSSGIYQLTCPNYKMKYTVKLEDLLKKDLKTPSFSFRNNNYIVQICPKFNWSWSL
jgi:hypothetical protein